MENVASIDVFLRERTGNVEMIFPRRYVTVRYPNRNVQRWLSGFHYKPVHGQ